MPREFLPASQAQPDAGHFRQEGLRNVFNVAPVAHGWKPLSGVVGWAPKGAINASSFGLYRPDTAATHDDCDALFVFPQDATIKEDVWAALRKVAGGYDLLRWTDHPTTWWTVLSKAGGYSATLAAYGSQFARFGQWVIWTNGIDDIQGYQIGASALFADLLTSTYKPKARLVKPMFGILPHVVFAYLTEGATVYPDKVAWSPADNPTLLGDPDTLPGETADTQVLADDRGAIYGMLRLGDVATGGGQVFLKEGAVHIMRWPAAFQLLSQSFGTVFPNSTIEDGDTCYWWDSRRGPTRLRAGGAPEALLRGIAERQLLEEAFSDIALHGQAGTRHVYGMNLPTPGLVGWAIRTWGSQFSTWCNLLVLWDNEGQRIGFCDTPRFPQIPESQWAIELVATGQTNGPSYPWGLLRDVVFGLATIGQNPGMASQGQQLQKGRPHTLTWPYWSMSEKPIRVKAIRVEATISDDSGPAPYVARVRAKEGPMDVPVLREFPFTSRTGGWITGRGPGPLAQYQSPEIELPQSAVDAGYDPAKIDLIHGIEIDYDFGDAGGRGK